MIRLWCSTSLVVGGLFAGVVMTLTVADEIRAVTFQEIPTDEATSDESSEDFADRMVAEPDEESTTPGLLGAAEEAGESAEESSDEVTSEEETEQTDDATSSAGPQSGESADNEVEVIRERYPNRAIKIERQVTQDSTGNYVNHGAWKMWDQKGVVISEGSYIHGQRQGTWNRWYRLNEVELLKTSPYNQFTGPFISQATFDHDKLNGRWTFYDNKQHKIHEIDYVDGQRHGHAVWWYPNGRKMREADFDHSEVNGMFLEWAPDGRILAKDSYQHGRKIASRTEKFPGGATKTEGVYLFAKEIETTPDDWWNCKLAAYTKTGKDEKHGAWRAWYPNGQKQLEGEYSHDIQVGRFLWWYQNGQKAIDGGYADGEQQGKWVWWFENGQKSIQGEYAKGHPLGHWTWWQEDGKVARSSHMEQGDGQIVHLPPTTLPSHASKRPEPPSAAPSRTTKRPEHPTTPSRSKVR